MDLFNGRGRKDSKERKPFITLKGSFVAGAVALLFLTVGYQISLFVHTASVAKIASDRDTPDTVWVKDKSVASDGFSSHSLSEPYTDNSYHYAGGDSDVADSRRFTGSGRFNADSKEVYGSRGNEANSNGNDAGSRGNEANSKGNGSNGNPTVFARRSGANTHAAERVREKVGRRKVESFVFNPNTVSVEELQRLGFSLKQAAAIDNYRMKGGSFRRKSDFAKSFVVSDSIYRRLEPYIKIPLIDLNLADSAAFDSLPGIGGYFASKMVSYRKRLGGYSCKEQLMDIYHFDREKYDALSDLVTVDLKYVKPYPLWTLPADSLSRHPYIASMAVAKGIVMYREHNPKSKWTVSGLAEAGVITSEQQHSISMLFIENVQ